RRSAAAARRRRVSLPRHGRPARRRGLLPELLVLARERAGPVRTRRSGGDADGTAGRTGQRRRPVFGRNRPRRARLSRQVSARASASRADRRGGGALGSSPSRAARFMIASAIVAGFIATLVMTTIMRGASELGLTRADLALLLGTTVSDDRRRARAL